MTSMRSPEIPAASHDASAPTYSTKHEDTDGFGLHGWESLGSKYPEQGRNGTRTSSLRSDAQDYTPVHTYNNTPDGMPRLEQGVGVEMLSRTPTSAQLLPRSTSLERGSPIKGRGTYHDPTAPWSSKPPRRRGFFACRWHDSWSMYLFFFFGVLCAVGHHIYYSTLHGRPADNQVVMLRYGTILAFAAKAGLGAAVVTAYRQRVWATVRTRAMSVKGLDSLFSATEDLVSLMNLELIKSAKTAVALAVFLWVSPLIIILTSNTLLVEPMTAVDVTNCPGVRTLNFAFEETNEWRDQTQIDHMFEIPLSFWNSTQTKDSDDWFDYYTGPNPRLVQTATIGAFLEEVVPKKNAAVDICSGGWNCTYEVSFVAPGYKCTELANGVGAKAEKLKQESGFIEAPFGLDIIFPKGEHAYYAYATGGEYSTSQMKEVAPGGRPISKPPYPKHLGAFRTEPVVWVGYSLPVDENKPPPQNTNDPNWKSAYTSKLFACEHYETEYHVRFNYTESAQHTTVLSRKYLKPVVNTTFLPDKLANDGTADNTTAQPEENYVYPTDKARYRRVAAYHSLGYILRDFINGTVRIDPNTSNPNVNTAAMQTKLLDARTNYFPAPHLPDLLMQFYEELIMSLFSNSLFVPVAWAAQPNEQSGERLTGGSPVNQSAYLYPCTRTRTANMYNYHLRDLWIVYAIAIFFALLCVALGTWAIWENDGAVRDVRFSSITAATRGPALEKLHWEGRGSASGADVPPEVKSARMGYGLLHGDGTPSHFSRRESRYGGADGDMVYHPPEIRYGFGLEGDVRQMREGSIIRNWRW